jgi:hypothetical protein
MVPTSYQSGRQGSRNDLQDWYGIDSFCFLHDLTKRKYKTIEASGFSINLTILRALACSKNKYTGCILPATRPELDLQQS